MFSILHGTILTVVSSNHKYGTNMLHKLCLVNDYYTVTEVQGASGNMDDIDEDDENHAGCKWNLEEKYTEAELEQMFENGQILPSGQIMT